MRTELLRAIDSEKQPLTNRPGHRYARLTDDEGIVLSVHDGEPGILYLAGYAPNGKPHTSRLNLRQAVVLKAALELWIADQTEPETPDGD